MAARKTAAARNIAVPPKDPVGQWAKVLAEGQSVPGVAIEPFEVHEGLTLRPLTPRRAAKLGAAQAAYLVALAAMASAQRVGANASREEIADIQARIDESLAAYNEALFGEDEYPLVQAYFAEQDAWKQELFGNAVKKQFLRLPDEDGKCPACGHVPGSLEERVEQLEAALAEVDPEHPALGGDVGKAPASSTTSSTTGVKSSVTSRKRSTV